MDRPGCTICLETSIFSEHFIQTAGRAKHFLKTFFFEAVCRGKLLEMKIGVAAIELVRFSSKSELSSRFFGRLKFSALFEYIALHHSPSKIQYTAFKNGENFV